MQILHYKMYIYNKQELKKFANSVEKLCF